MITTPQVQNGAAPIHTDSGELKVLYIAGNARCGSTLLGRLLNEVDGFALVGEPQNMWDRCFKQNRLCGCGTPFRECEFWTAVVARAFGGFEEIDIERIERTKRAFEPIKKLPRLLATRRNADIEYYIETLTRFYRSIQLVSGARVIVDASKTPVYGHFLSRVPEIRMRVVHLMRDSRAVAYSNQRRKLNPAIHWEQSFFGTAPPVTSSLMWIGQNLATVALHAHSEGFTMIRYEDFVKSPQATIDRLCDLMGEKPSELNLAHGVERRLRVSHTTAGNPGRFDSTVTIRLDDEWTRKMPIRQKLLVTAATMPLLIGYGYRLGS